MKVRALWGSLPFLIMLLIIGCSDTNGPVAPPNEQPVQEVHLSGSDVNHYLWSYSLVFVDATGPGTPDIQIVPLRQAEGHWNVRSWLENGPCTDCLSIENISQSSHQSLLVQVRIEHPFPSANLTGFDVRGIPIFNGSGTFSESGLTYSDRILGDGELLNPDGYTTLYNPLTSGSGPNGLQGFSKGNFATLTTPDSLLNGYKRHITSGGWNIRNAFFAGEASSHQYDIAMPSGKFVFGYAVDASWAQATNKPVTEPMIDFPPEANCPEPWHFSTSVEPIGEGFTPDGGSEIVTIDVYDHDGESSHGDPVLECSEIFDGTISADFVETGDGFSRWEATVTNENLAGFGIHKCLISVEANENAGSPEWLDLTAYQIISFDVQTNFNLENVSPWLLTLKPYDICIDGDFAYLACRGAGLHIFDITDPENPVWVNSVDSIAPYAIDVDGGIAAVRNNISDTDDLYFLDVSTPETASILTSFNLDSSPFADFSIVVSGGFAYVGVDSKGLSIYDIDPPEEIGLVSNIDEGMDLVNQIAYEDGYIWMTMFDHFGSPSDTPWVKKIDVDPPESVHVVKSKAYHDLAGVSGIAVANGHVLVGCNTFQLEMYIDVLDSSDLSQVHSLESPSFGFEISGNYLYTSSYHDAPANTIIDISDPASAYVVGSYPGQGRLGLYGNEYLYHTQGLDPVAAPGAWQIIDINPPETPVEIKTYGDTFSSDDCKPAVSGNYLYVTDLPELRIFDISTPEDVVEVHQVEIPTFPTTTRMGVAISGDYAFVDVDPSGFHVIDISTPESAAIVHTIVANSLGPIAINNGYAYVSGAPGIQIVDIDPPASATKVGTVDLDGTLYAISFSGNYMYVSFEYNSQSENGVYILDCTNPEAPSIVNTVVTAQPAFDLAVYDGYAYVGVRYTGLQVIDVIPPEDASLLPAVLPDLNGSGLVIGGGHLFETGASTFNLVNIDTPEMPQMEASLDMHEAHRYVLVDGGYAYLTGGGFGIVKLY